MLLQSYEPVV